MALKIAARGSAVQPFIVMDVLRAANERAANGHDILHLEVGQPSTAAPRGVLEAARQALEHDRIGYVEALGLPALRTRLARHYADWYGLALDPERIVITPGSSGAFLLAFLAAFDVGERVALAAPGYPAYRNILLALGLEVVELPASAEHDFQPTIELLERERDLAGLIVASPSNPTGTMIAPEPLRKLAEYCHRRGIRLVSDEIYHGIVFEGLVATAAALSPSAIVINSFSKYFSMTGWRIGWMVLPADMIRPVECLAQNLFISTPTLSQHAALGAFDCHEELQSHVARYRANRDLLVAGLPKAGFDRLTRPTGAFYLYADIAHLSNDSRDFCRRMLEEANIAATPGLDFDRARGHGTLRFSFAGATAEMAQAVERLITWRR